MPEYDNWTGSLIDIELKQAICARRCILFVGAGLSAGVEHRVTRKQLPNWPLLLENMLTYAQLNLPSVGSAWVADINQLITDNELLMAAQELRDALGKHNLRQFLIQSFSTRYVKPGKNHLLLPEINFRAILTTNYDNLIEQGYEKTKPKVKVLQKDSLYKTPLPLRYDDEFFVFKLHGQYNDDVVMGTRDYQNVMFNLPGYQQFLETLFSVYTVLFIGFSGGDPNLEAILDRLSSLYQRQFDTHYLLMKRGDLSPVARNRWERDRRVRVIVYDNPDGNYRQIETFLHLLTKTNLDCTHMGGHIFDTPKQKEQLKIFISYSHRDQELSNRIRAFLSQLNHQVWLDVDIKSGQNWSSNIEQAISEADCIIVILTETSLNSSYVQSELRYAQYWSRERNQAYLPIVVGGIGIPPYLRDKYLIAISTEFTPSNQQLLANTLKHISRDLAPAQTISKSDSHIAQEVLIRRIERLMRKFDGHQVSGQYFGIPGYLISLPSFSKIERNVVRDLRRFDIITENPSWVVEVWETWRTVDPSKFYEYLNKLREDANAEIVWLVVAEADNEEVFLQTSDMSEKILYHLHFEHR